MQDQMNGQQPPTMKVNVTSEDIVICECGSELFIQVVRVAKVPAMIIGQKPGFAPVGGGLACSSCNKVVDETFKSKKELNTPTIEG